MDWLIGTDGEKEKMGEGADSYEETPKPEVEKTPEKSEILTPEAEEQE